MDAAQIERSSRIERKNKEWSDEQAKMQTCDCKYLNMYRCWQRPN